MSATCKLVGKRSRTALTVKTVIYPLPFLSSISPVTLICKFVGLVGLQCESCRCQPLTRGYVVSLAYSYSQLCNGEAIGNPWYSQIHVYTSAHIEMVVVELYSEGPAACGLLGALAQDVTL